MHAQEEAAPAILCDMTSAPDTGDGRLAEYARLFDAAFVYARPRPIASAGACAPTPGSRRGPGTSPIVRWPAARS